MKHLFTTVIFLLFLTILQAQSNFKKVHLNENGDLEVEAVFLHDYPIAPLVDVNPEPFLSLGYPAFPITKNTRGVALADLDGDGIDEVLIGINKTFYAIKGDGSILFEKELTGAILLPPTVADLDNDGDLEIVINCGYPTTVGGVYVLDHEGNDLPGWPVSFGGNWMINAASVSDIDGDGVMEIVTGERVSGTVGNVHVLKLDGTELNENWPVNIGATPAFTPSIGDVNNDGNKDIVIAGSSSGMHIFNSDGSLFDGFPVQETGVSYSYQSPILVDLDNDGQLEIVGSNHGDAPAFYAMKSDGTYVDGWPVPISNWTYAPSTVADVDGDDVYEIFMGVPVVSSDGSDLPTIFGLKPDGINLDNFPIEKYGGNEGVLSIADVNNDGVMDLVFGSNITDNEGYGFIHAYSLDGSGEIEGFPLRPRGFTFLNGAVLGDIDGDGMMDLTANSYTLNFGADVDSVFVNSYNLNIPFSPDKILSNGYKANNTRDGLITNGTMSTNEISTFSVNIYPNPSSGILNLNFEKTPTNLILNVFDLSGKNVYTKNTSGNSITKQYHLENLPKGIYIIQIIADKQKSIFKWIKN